MRSYRIFLNIIATYGRSLFSLVCGLFTARWVLMALGQEDFGLYGVVGGLTIFITLINTLLSAATGRFYAVSIGEAQSNANQNVALENCHRWFSVSVLIHSLVPLILLAIGYPIGLWAVDHFLVIPAVKLEACHWVFRFVCITSFVSMVNVPFQAMYMAKQYIAELTVYSIAQTAANVVFFYYMVTHPAVWLVKYAAWMCIVSVAPQLIICIRALKIFPECQFKLFYAFDWCRTKQLLAYAFWQLFGGLGAVFRGQGIQILVNKCFGASINASMTIANQVSTQSSTLAAGLGGAFLPAIATAYGAGRMDEMRSLSYRACKFGIMLSIALIVPLCLEISEILRLWLKSPPPYCAGLCLAMIIAFIIDSLSYGHMLAVNASGRIAAYQVILGSCLIATLPIAWLFVEFGLGVYGVAVGVLIGQIGCAWGRVWFARSIVGMSVWLWVRQTVLPCAIIAAIVCAVGFLPRFLMPLGLNRVLTTILFCELAYLPLAWLILDHEERDFVLTCIRKVLHHS